jgi:hypothetical protein
LEAVSEHHDGDGGGEGVNNVVLVERAVLVFVDDRRSEQTPQRLPARLA